MATSNPRMDGGDRAFYGRVARWNRRQRAARMRSLRGRAWRDAKRWKVPTAEATAPSQSRDEQLAKDQVPDERVVDAQEDRLLRRHEERQDVHDTSALLELVDFYRVRGREDRIRELVCAFMAEAGADLEVRAWCYLLLGQSSERTRDYEEAVEHYRNGVACEPGHRFTAYFLHNNLGYSLVTVGRSAEAEWYCRTAIGIDPWRTNGYKNLGLSLHGQGEDARALEAWIYATRTDPRDPRALHLAEWLVEENPDLLFLLPGLEDALDACRRAVQGARSSQAEG